MPALFPQLRILDPEHPLYSRPAVAALKELAAMGSISSAEFCTLLLPDMAAFDVLVEGNIISDTGAGCVEFQRRALAWHFLRG